jgi:hypothetical protein
MDNEKKHQISLTRRKGIDHLHLEAKPVHSRRRIDDPQADNVAYAKPTGRMIVSGIAEQSKATSAQRLYSNKKGKRKNREVCVCPCFGILRSGRRASGSIVTPDERAMGDTL